MLRLKDTKWNLNHLKTKSKVQYPSAHEQMTYEPIQMPFRFLSNNKQLLRILFVVITPQLKCAMKRQLDFESVLLFYSPRVVSTHVLVC